MAHIAVHPNAGVQYSTIQYNTLLLLKKEIQLLAFNK